ncbi:MAG TPA: hypothetical protein PLE74_04775 [Candidatus Cloacimonadota bacterium]|nr:hypothetical protein [Candidatus Cloacimonadota bacterium]
MDQPDREIYINSFLGENPGFLMPEGRISKEATGIGATHSEIVAPRNSIIIFPSRSIAFTKHIKHEDQQHTFYVGSYPDGKTVVTQDQITAYHQSTVQFKKILCVANSLPKVFNAIGAKEVYSHYFLMFDEIDKFQNESTFRSELEYCIDYYLDPRCKGCLVSATMGHFSNKLLRDQKLTRIFKGETPKMPVELVYFDTKDEDSLKCFIYTRITTLGSDKLVVAHKSVRRMKSIIEGLPPSVRKEIVVLGGSECKEQLPAYCSEIKESGILPGKIVFLTSAYFAGFDVDEQCQIVVISDRSTTFSLLTMEEIFQVVGRFRKGYRSLTLLVPDITFSPPEVGKKVLLDTANTLLPKLQEVLNKGVEMHLDTVSTEDLLNTFLSLSKEQVLLFRKARTGELAVSSFTIDQFVNRNKSLKGMYGNGKLSIRSTLKKYFRIDSTSVMPQQALDSTILLDELLLNWISMIKEDYAPEGKTEKKLFNRILKVHNLLWEADVPVFIKDTWDLSDILFADEVAKHLVLSYPERYTYPSLLNKKFKVGGIYTGEEIMTKMMEIRSAMMGRFASSLTLQKSKKLLSYSFNLQYTSTIRDGKRINVYRIQDRVKSKYGLIQTINNLFPPEP